MLRPPITPPPLDTDPSLVPRITIRHPGYVDGKNVLFDLACLDPIPGSHLRGVQYAIVHTACAIVAGNRFDGWLIPAYTAITAPASTTPASSLPASTAPSSATPSATAPASTTAERVSMRDSDILHAGQYYFYLPGYNEAVRPSLPAALQGGHFLSTPYPVVPNFRAWCFPRSQPAQRPAPLLPDCWRNTSLAFSQKEPKDRDETCRITGHALALHTAHIIPESEREWFNTQDMAGYGYSSFQAKDPVGAPENLILLRMDLHNAWDGTKFSLVPKRDPAADHNSPWSWTVHVNDIKPLQMVDLYHNLRLQAISGVSREFLFARFAYDLFPRLIRFLQQQARQCLLSADVPAGQWCSAEDCLRFTQNQGLGRSSSSPRRRNTPSPSKRSRVDDTVGDREGHSPRSSREYTRKRRKTDNGSLHSGMGSSFMHEEAEQVKEGLEEVDYSEADEQTDDEAEASRLWLQKQEAFERKLARANAPYPGWTSVSSTSDQDDREPLRGRKRRRSHELVGVQ